MVLNKDEIEKAVLPSTIISLCIVIGTMLDMKCKTYFDTYIFLGGRCLMQRVSSL